MMNTVFLPDDPAQQALILEISDRLHATSAIKTHAYLETDSALVVQLVNELAAAPLGVTVPAPVGSAALQERCCEICGKAYTGRKSTCSRRQSPEQRKRYQNAHRAARKGTTEPAEPAVVVPVAKSVDRNWPDLAEFKILEGEKAGRFLARWELQAMVTSGDTPQDTLVLSKGGAQFRVFLNGGRKLKLVLATPEVGNE